MFYLSGRGTMAVIEVTMMTPALDGRSARDQTRLHSLTHHHAFACPQERLVNDDQCVDTEGLYASALYVTYVLYVIRRNRRVRSTGHSIEHFCFPSSVSHGYRCTYTSHSSSGIDSGADVLCGFSTRALYATGSSSASWTCSTQHLEHSTTRIQKSGARWRRFLYSQPWICLLLLISQRTSAAHPATPILAGESACFFSCICCGRVFGFCRAMSSSPESIEVCYKVRS